MDDWSVVADPHDIASHRDLRSVGLSAREIGRLAGTGSLTKVANGWYAIGPVRDEVHRHELATRAMLRSHDAPMASGYHSALVLLGVPAFRADLGVVRLVRTTSGPTRTTPSLRVGKTVLAEFVAQDTVVPGLAVVQHGIAAGPVAALVAADAALRMGLITVDSLSAALDLTTKHPHTKGLRLALAHADVRHESPGETRLAHALRVMGIGATPQVRISAEGRVAFVDFFVDGTRVVIEFDGRIEYARSATDADPFGRSRPGEQVLWEEKRREDWLRELGYLVVRVVWSDLEDLRALAARIHAAIRRSHGLTA